MRDTIKELAITGALAAIAVTALASLSATERPAMSFQYASGLEFGTLPKLYAGLMLLLCLINAAYALCARKKQAADAPETDTLSLMRAAATIVMLFVFVSLIGKMHFALLCAGFLCILFLVYGKRNMIQIAGISLGGAAVLHGIFVTALNLRL